MSKKFTKMELAYEYEPANSQVFAEVDSMLNQL